MFEVIAIFIGTAAAMLTGYCWGRSDGYVVGWRAAKETYESK